MAALSTAYQTFADIAKMKDPGGGFAYIINVLSEFRPMLSDAFVFEGNLPTGNRTTLVTTLPTGTWRLINKGVTSTKGTTRQVDDACGQIARYAAVDATLARLGGDINGLRARNDAMYLEGISNDVIDAVIYGNSGVNPEQPHGFAPRYNSLTGTPGSTNVISGGGSGADNTSVWLITWGANQVGLMYPKGTKAGLLTQDLGETNWPDSDTNYYRAYVSYYEWTVGLAVMDYRYVTRICNIDVSNLTADASSGADLMDKMSDAYFSRPSMDLGNMARTYFYCNKTVAKYLTKQAQNKSNVLLSIDNPAGKPVVSFYNAPVHICDAITETEATIS